MTVWLAVQCIHCHSTKVVKNGKSRTGKQRYRCQNDECSVVHQENVGMVK